MHAHLRVFAPQMGTWDMCPLVMHGLQRLPTIGLAFSYKAGRVEGRDWLVILWLEFAFFFQVPVLQIVLPLRTKRRREKREVQVGVRFRGV